MNEGGSENSWDDIASSRQDEDHSSESGEHYQSNSFDSDFDEEDVGDDDEELPVATLTRVNASVGSAISSPTISSGHGSQSTSSSEKDFRNIKLQTDAAIAEILTLPTARERQSPAKSSKMVIERTKEVLESLRYDPYERNEAYRRASEIYSHFMIDRKFPLHLEGQVIHSFGEITTAPGFSEENFIYPIGLSISRLVYSVHQERVVRCTLTIYDAADSDRLRTLPGFDEIARNFQSGPFFHILVDCPVVDEHAGVSEVAKDALQRAAILNEDESSITDTDETLKYPNMDFFGTSLRYIWREVLVSLGTLLPDEAHAEENALYSNSVADRSVLLNMAPREPADEEEESLRRRVGLALRIRTDLRTRSLTNSRILALAHGIPFQKNKHRVRRVLEIRSADVTKKLRMLPPQSRSGMTAWAESEISAQNMPFFSTAVNRLLESLEGVDECMSYVFMEHRLRGEPLSLEDIEEAEGCGTGLSRSAMECLEEAWVAQGEAAARSRRERDRSAKRKLGDAERARAKRLKDAELRSHKQGVEQRRIERVRQRIEQRTLKEHAKEKERLARALRRSLESITSRRRVAVRAILNAVVEAEDTRSSIITSPGTASSRKEIEFLEKASAYRIGTITSYENENVPLEFPMFNEKSALLETRIASLEYLGLDVELTGAVIQLWDFLHAYKLPLELTHPPSLEDLAAAFKAADSVALKKEKNRRECAQKIELLHNLAECLVCLLAPPVLACMGFPMTLEPGEEESGTEPRGLRLAAQLSGRLTWGEVARLALQAHAHRELGADEREVPQRLLSRPPPAPIHFAGASAIPAITAAVTSAASLDRHTIHLLAHRVMHRYGKSTENVQKYLGQFRIQLPSPNCPCVDVSHWAMPLLNLMDGLNLPESNVNVKSMITEAMKRLPNDENFFDIRNELMRALAAYDEEDNGKCAADIAIKVIELCPDWPPKPPSVPTHSKLKNEKLFLENLHAETALPQDPGCGYRGVSLEQKEKAQIEKRAYVLRAAELAAKRSGSLEGNGQDDYEDEEEEDGSDFGVSADEPSRAQSTLKPAKQAFALFEIPLEAPEPLIRCQRILQALLLQSDAEQFIYPKDPAIHTGYYDALAKPWSLSDVASELQNTENFDINVVVTRFVEGVRLVFANARCHAGGGAGTGGTGGNADLVAAAEAMMVSTTADHLGCIFERLLIDWLIDPQAPALSVLDDDRCHICLLITREEGDATSTTPYGDDLLMCDRCDAKYHISCLQIDKVPDEDWFCPRCVEMWSMTNIDSIVGFPLIPLNKYQCDDSVTVIVKSIRWRQGGSHASSGEFVYQLCPFSSPSDPPMAELTWNQLVSNFSIPSDLPRPFPILTSVPGYSLVFAHPPSTSSGSAGIIAALDPTLSARAAELDSISPEYRALGQAVAAMREEGEFGQCYGVLGARRWLRILSALVQAVPLVSVPLQRIMTDADTAALEEARTAQQADINDFSILSLPRNLLPSEPQVSSSDSVSDDELKVESSIVGESVNEFGSRSSIANDVEPSSTSTSSEEDDDATVSEDNPFVTNSHITTDRTFSAFSAKATIISPPGSSSKRGSLSGQLGRLSNASPIPPLLAGPGRGRVRCSKDGSDPPIKRLSGVKGHPPLTSLCPPDRLPMGDDESNMDSSKTHSAANIWRTERQERRWSREDTLHLRKLRQELLGGLGKSVAKEMMAVLGDMGSESSESEISNGENQKYHKYNIPRCAFCGGDELALCSTMVQAQTWEEAAMLFLGLPPNRGDTPEEMVLREFSSDYHQSTSIPPNVCRKLRRLGLIAPSDKVLESRTDAARFLWLPIDEAIRGEELACLVAALKAEKEEMDVDGRYNLRDMIAVSGSLVAHECCAEAVAALRVPKFSVLANRVRREIYEEAALNNIGGRTQPLGRDSLGRLYWQFPHAPTLLLVQPLPLGGWEEGGCETLPTGATPALWMSSYQLTSNISSSNDTIEISSLRRWLCFSNLKEIGKQFLRLNTDDIHERDLQLAIIRRYPRLREALFDSNFISCLFEETRLVERALAISKPLNLPSVLEFADTAALNHSTFNVGQRVILSSSFSFNGSGSIQYLATVISPAIWSDSSKQWLVRIAPHGWPNRFSSWVPSTQLQFANDSLIQTAAKEYEKTSRVLALNFMKSAPKYMQGLLALDAFDLPQRGRSSKVAPPCFQREELVISGMERARSTLLTVEAALPLGAWQGIEGLHIDDWRKFVQNADSSRDLMEAYLLLEASIGKLWIRGGGLKEVFLPPPSAALRAATPAAVCLHLWVLDRSLVYDRTGVINESERRANRKSSSSGTRVAATEAEFIMGVGVRRVPGAKRSHAKKRIGAGRIS